MEDNKSVASRRETTTSDGEEGPEESSWTMYFEDFFSEESNIPTKDDCRLSGHRHHHHRHHHHHHDDSSSMISDAASFVGMKKMINVRVEEPSSSKKKRSREVSIASHDLEDTASSPSRSPNVSSMMNLLDNNRHEGVVGDDDDDTCNGKGKTLSGQDDGIGLTLDLKKKGLCLVPLSVVANYLG